MSAAGTSRFAKSQTLNSKRLRQPAVRFARRVFVLHVFEKKSRWGLATPKADMDLIRQRLKAAKQTVKELES